MSWIKRPVNMTYVEFDLTERNLDEIEIRETNKKNTCFIWDKRDDNIIYNSFVLDKNSKSKIICEISFHKSSQTEKYIPRPIFRRLTLNGDAGTTKKDVIINLSDSNKPILFWKLIGFLYQYKGLVDLGEFDKTYEVVTIDDYLHIFKDKTEKEKLEEFMKLSEEVNISSEAIKNLTFENRKRNLHAFYLLLKNEEVEGMTSYEYYRKKYDIPQGEEAIWHHFLKTNDWILGLNADIRFMKKFLEEQKVGLEDSLGTGSPQVDFLGISDFTTLIELKHSNTEIFKKNKSKGRANTWDFTSDFFEGVSQCLGQKAEFEKLYENKNFVDENGKRLDKSAIQTVDPKSIFIIGNKKKEFPIDELNDLNLRKNETLERFRRNNRNIDIITFDELFERAYHIVFSKKLDKDWYTKSYKELFE